MARKKYESNVISSEKPDSVIDNYPVYVITKKKTFTVVGEFDPENPEDLKRSFKPNYGYLNKQDNHIWIYYADSIKNMSNEYPLFYISNKQFKFNHPIEENFRKFKLSLVSNLSVDSIKTAAKEDIANGKEIVYSPEELMEMNSPNEVFRPVFYSGEDFLKRLIKTALNELEVNLSKYKAVLKHKYTITNMKSAIISRTKMSVSYFQNWTNLLGLDFVLILVPNEETKGTPEGLKDPLIYFSARDKVVNLSEIGEFKITSELTDENNETEE